MKVTSILKGKGTEVTTVKPDATVSEALGVLEQHRIGAVVVSAGDGSIDGILSERDIVRRLSHDADLLDAAVARIMTSEVVTCTPDSRINELMALMTDRRIRHLPVVEDGKLSGIVSIGDVVKWRLRELEEEAARLEEYIHHGR